MANTAVIKYTKSVYGSLENVLELISLHNNSNDTYSRRILKTFYYQSNTFKCFIQPFSVSKCYAIIYSINSADAVRTYLLGVNRLNLVSRAMPSQLSKLYYSETRKFLTRLLLSLKYLASYKLYHSFEHCINPNGRT